MGREKGKPSGRNKPEGTGIPSNFDTKDIEKDRELTEKYTTDDRELTRAVRQKHPNRNVDKGNATNAGGYKN